MRLSEALNAAVSRLESEDVGSPRMNGELLLMFVLGCDRAYLYTHPERQLSPEEQLRYDEAIGDRARGVPAQYITGHQEFWGLDLLVNADVLIPRPETEHVIEAVLELSRHLPSHVGPRLVDVGTGSGCIALALAAELPEAEIHAVDISEQALAIARLNAERLQFSQRVHFHRSDLLGDIRFRDLDFVVSNPPYVGESEADKVQKEVRRFEPHVALFGGVSGLDIYRRLIPQASQALHSGGWLVTEIGFSQRPQLVELLEGWDEVSFRPDLQGIPRVVLARRK